MKDKDKPKEIYSRKETSSLVRPLMDLVEVYQDRAMRAEMMLSSFLRPWWFGDRPEKKEIISLLDRAMENPFPKAMKSMEDYSKPLHKEDLEEMGFKLVPKYPYTGKAVYLMGEYDVPGLEMKGDKFIFDIFDHTITYGPLNYTKPCKTIADVSIFCSFFA